MAAVFAHGKRNSRKADSHQEKQWQEEEAARQRQQQQDSEHRRRNNAPSGKMTEAQALEILELKPGVTEQEIRAAYNRLMQKMHPDVGGSNFFAKQLNAARDRLLRKDRSS